MEILNYLNQTKNTWFRREHIRLNEYMPLILSLTEDDSDLHQRSQCERYNARGEYNIFHTHDTLELSQNAKQRHWTGINSIRSDCHLIR